MSLLRQVSQVKFKVLAVTSVIKWQTLVSDSTWHHCLSVVCISMRSFRESQSSNSIRHSTSIGRSPSPSAAPLLAEIRSWLVISPWGRVSHRKW